MPNSFFGKKISKRIQSYDRQDTLELGNNSTYMLRKNYIPYHFDKSCFNDYIEVEFEGLKVMAMAGYDQYLTKNFGDWRTPPPEDQRYRHGYTVYLND